MYGYHIEFLNCLSTNHMKTSSKLISKLNFMVNTMEDICTKQYSMLDTHKSNRLILKYSITSFIWNTYLFIKSIELNAKIGMESRT